MSDAELILLGGALLGAGIAAAMVANRLRVPGLILFLVLGMLVGEDGIGGVDFDNVHLTRTLGTIGLVLILFEGGLNAGWKEIRPVLGSAISLATIGTLGTAVIGGFAAVWLFNVDLLEGLIIGSAIAATDSAAIFAMLRGSRLRRKIARALEGESGMNDPIAVLLVTGFIAWIETPGYGVADMALEFVLELSIGSAVGIAVGLLARAAFVRLDFPTTGLYPVATMAAAALSFGTADIAHGSGFISVYLTGLVLGSGILPALRTVTAFHGGLAWVSQISLFFMLGLLVDPVELVPLIGQGLALALVIMLVARPIAVTVATALARFNLRERLMLSWAGLRGAVPIWLATFPVIAGISGHELEFNAIFFVVLASTLLQGFTFEPLADRLGLTSDEPALPRPLVETGMIQELGGDVIAFRIRDGDAIVGRMVKELGLPREALVNLIVRDGEALLPRGSTVLEAGDDLHVLIRRENAAQIERLTQRWHEGPIERPRVPRIGGTGAPAVFSVRPTRPSDGDTGNPAAVNGIEVAMVLRQRPDAPAAVVALVDGRFAVTGPKLIALGGRRNLTRWCAERAERPGTTPQERDWLQEAIGIIDAPAMP